VDIVTIAILVLVVWCAASLLLGLALGATFRTLLRDERLDETVVHDDALTRDDAGRTGDADDVSQDVEIRRAAASAGGRRPRLP
jgi:hypothetical protein